MKSYLLGIDIGTSACKVAVFDRNGKVLAAASGALVSIQIGVLASTFPSLSIGIADQL